MAVAFAQHLWRVLRTTSVKVSDLDLLYGIRENFFLFAHAGPIRTAPLLVILALAGWLVPVAVLYPPGALIVVPTPVTQIINTSVPTFNASYVGDGSLSGIGDNAIALIQGDETATVNSPNDGLHINFQSVLSPFQVEK